MKVFQIRQDDRFAWYETSKEHMEDMVNKCNWQGRVLELAKYDSAHQVQPLPKWIDDQKGSGPNTDALIEYIEQLRAAQPVQQPAPVAAAQPVGRVWECREDYFLYAKLDDGVAGSGAVKLGDLLYTAAPVAAPVAGQPLKFLVRWFSDGDAEPYDTVFDNQFLADELKTLRESQGFASVKVIPLFDVPAASVHDKQEQEYIGTRLRRVAKAAGVTVDYGNDAAYYAGAFSILGDIARALDKPAASVQPVTCQIYGHVVGHCGECNVGDEGAAQDAADTNKVLADNFLKQTCGTAASVQPWQPISTAPNDGRTLLLGAFNSMGNWRTMRGQWFSQSAIDDEWEDPDGAEAGWYETAVEPDVPNCWPISPTHWMHLPGAPNAPHVVQPDGGRDAALVGSLEVVKVGFGFEVRRDGQPIAYGNSQLDMQLIAAAWNHVAAHPANVAQPASDAALLSAIRNGVPLEEPVSVAKAMMAQEKARASLSGGTGPLAAVFLVNIQAQPWTHTEETATAYADGFNRGVDWLRSSIIEYADKLPSANVAQVDGDLIITQRDAFRDVADNLANAIAAYFGVDIGEYSSANCPWTEALRVIEEAGQVVELSDEKIIEMMLQHIGADAEEAIAFARAILAAAKKGPTT